jgi:KUP system potassium uptake protein
VFGPIMVVWFVTIALLGVHMIVHNPQVLWALNPMARVSSFFTHGFQAFIALGGVVLALTGAEALYADMGHFGKSRSASPGSALCCRRWCSTTSVRARCC